MKKLNNKGLAIKPIIIAVSALLIIAVFGFIFLNGKNSTGGAEMFKKSISNQFNALSKMLTTAEELNVLDMISKNQTTASIKLIAETNMEDLELLNDYTFEAIAGFDKINKKAGINLIVSDKTDKLDALIYQVKNENYLYFNNLYDKNIKMGTSEDLFDFSMITDIKAGEITDEEYTYLFDKLASIINDNINEKDITKESVKEKIYDKEMSLIKLTYVLNGTNFKKIVKAWNEDFLGDSKVIDILSKINESENIKESLTLEDISYSGESKISLFVNNKYEILKITEDANYNLNGEKSKNFTSFTSYSDIYTLEVDDKLGDNKLYIKFEDKEEKIIDFDMTIETDSQTTENVKGTIKSNVKTNTNKADGKISLNLTYDNGEKINLKMDVDYGIESSFNLKFPTTANSTTLEAAFADEAFLTKLNENSIGKALFGFMSTGM